MPRRRRPHIISSEQFYPGGIAAENKLMVENFGTVPTGAGLPAGWTSSLTQTNISYSVNTDAPSPGGRSLDIDKSPAIQSHTAITKDAFNGDLEYVEIVYDATANAMPGVLLNWDPVTENGYLFQQDHAQTEVRLWRSTGGSFTFLAGAAFTNSAGTVYRMRLARSSDGVLDGTIWEDGDPMPAVTVSDAGNNEYTSGDAGIDVFSFNFTYTTTLHEIIAKVR